MDRRDADRNVQMLTGIACMSKLLEMLATKTDLNPLNPELNPICYLLALLGDHHFLHVSRLRVKTK